MKIKFFLALLILPFLFSCQDTEEPLTPEYPSQYYLVGYQGSFSPNAAFIEVSDSLYFYTLNENRTFQKQIGEEIATGTFEELELQDGAKGLELNFDNPDNTLIHSCYRGQEFFSFDEENRLVGEWQACDGPTMFFKGGPMVIIGGLKN